MALQITYYRIHKKCAAVYETASTRKYLHGRTETCRSLSVKSQKLVQIFGNSKYSAKEIIQAFKEACDHHVKFISKASNGFGVDRHLLGLRMLMKEGEECELFKDPLYARSQHWDLSTSGLFPGSTNAGTGFGAVVSNAAPLYFSV